MGKIDPKIISLVEGFKEKVRKRYGIIDMVLFGSQATGTAREDSDIDLIVVVKRYDKRLVAKLLMEWHEKENIGYPVDFIQYSEDRYKKLSKGINLVSQALSEGVVL